jgi:hypothetical protein
VTLTVALWFAAGLTLLFAGLAILMIGKPRQPSTPGAALVSLVINLFIVAVLVAAAVTR